MFETAHHWIPTGASQVQSRLELSLVKINSFRRLVLPSDKESIFVAVHH